jgi:hypothetical protein
MFGNAGREHMAKYGTTKEQLAKIAHKNHKHSVNNPYAQFSDEYSLEQILNSPMVYEPLTKLQCCPTVSEDVSHFQLRLFVLSKAHIQASPCLFVCLFVCLFICVSFSICLCDVMFLIFTV